MEITNVINKIRQLCNRTTTNGCSEKEALNAAEKAGELMTQYNLTLDKVFLTENACVEKSVVNNRKRRHPIDRTVVAISEFCDCKCWFSQGVGYYFFGLESDVDMCLYLYDVVFRAMEGETKTFQATPTYTNNTVARKTLTTSFQKGVGSSISKRLRTLRQERDEQEIPISCVWDGIAPETSIVSLKQNKVEEEYRKAHPRMRKGISANENIYGNAYSAGQSAGHNVNLNRPIHGKAQYALA